MEACHPYYSRSRTSLLINWVRKKLAPRSCGGEAASSGVCWMLSEFHISFVFENLFDSHLSYTIWKRNISACLKQNLEAIRCVSHRFEEAQSERFDCACLDPSFSRASYTELARRVAGTNTTPPNCCFVMEMMKILTQKLRQQTLSESQLFQPCKVDDGHDSGTGSDDEVELESLELAMLLEQENQENGTPPPLMLPVGSGCASPVRYSVSKRPLQLANLPVSTQASDHRLNQSSDLRHLSPRAHETSSLRRFDHHSSEEELAIINRTTSPTVTQEKRTWSQMNYQDYCGCQDGLNSSGSSDDEVKDLLSLSHNRPLVFSSSPPKGVRRLSKTVSPLRFLENVKASCASSMYPHKRCRQNNARDVSESPLGIQRPHLDFEKMQVLYRKAASRNRRHVHAHHRLDSICLQKALVYKNI